MLIALLAGCTGGSVAVDNNRYALGFDGVGCATAYLDAQAQTNAITIEATVQGDADATFASYPVLHWSDRLLLAGLDDGRTWFGSPDTSSGGVIDVAGFMDGKSHHLAGTWDEDGRIQLFVDGLRIGFADLNSGAGAGDTLEIGCWNTDQDWSFQGLIDEVRISSTVRYTTNFDEELPETFEVDADTTALWHFDEGEGTDFLDNTGSYDGTLVNVEWVPFDAWGE